MIRNTLFLPIVVLAILRPAIAADAPPVEVATASERPIIQIVEVSGTVTSPRSAILSPSVGGLIEDIQVDAGDRVDAGDVVVHLDGELATLVLAREEARLAEAQTALADSIRRLAEAERVGRTQAIPASQIKSIAAEVEQDRAALSAAEAAVAQQRAIVARHRVRAPFDGVISARIAEIGEWANPGDGLVELVATEGLRFDFRVPQEFYRSVTRDTRVVLMSDALADERIEGRVEAIVPVKDPGARTFLLRVVAENTAAGTVTPGISARGDLYVDANRSGIVVSRDALIRYPDGRRVVWVLDNTTDVPTVTERQVRTGLMFDGLVEVADGIEAGERVVVRGNEALQDGQSVHVR